MKRSKPTGCFLTHTLILGFFLFIAFWPADGPEGEEALGRAVAALISFPFLIVEVVMLVILLKSRTKAKVTPSGALKPSHHGPGTDGQ